MRIKMEMNYLLKVQVIRSQGQKPRLYITFPAALAAAIGLEPGEQVQWELLDRDELHLVRVAGAPPLQAKAKGKVGRKNPAAKT